MQQHEHEDEDLYQLEEDIEDIDEPLHAPAEDYDFGDDDPLDPDDIDETEEFQSEELTYQKTLIRSDIAASINKKIDAAPLTKRCKDALRAIVKAYFTQDVYLSNIRKPETPKLNLQFALSLVPLSCTIHDVEQPEYLAIRSLITDTFPFVLSRSQNGMERNLQGLKRIEQRSGMAAPYPAPVEQKTKKSRFWR